MTDYTIETKPKELREAISVAQGYISATSEIAHDQKLNFIDRLQELIDECDRHRPIDMYGRHGDDDHTPTCGCCSTCIQRMWDQKNGVWQPVVGRDGDICPECGKDHSLDE